MRASSTASGARHAVAPVPSPPRSARTVRSIASSRSPGGPQSTDAPADQPERVAAPAARVLGQHEPRPRVRGGQHAAQAIEQPREALAPAPQPRRALEVLLGGGGAHLRVEVGQQCRTAIALAGEEGQRLVEAAAVEVGVEIAQARRQAAPHLPVGAGPVAPRQLARAVAQPEERVELLEQLDRRRAPAQRADADPATGSGRGGHLEHREGDVQTAAQVDVAVDVLQARVARRAQALDEAALEQQRAELGVRARVLDGLGLLDPRSLVRGGLRSAPAPACAR